MESIVFIKPTGYLHWYHAEYQTEFFPIDLNGTEIIVKSLVYCLQRREIVPYMITFIKLEYKEQ